MYGTNVEGLDETVTNLHGVQADNLIAAEIARQDRMWGVSNERAALADGQLLLAGAAQLDFILLAREGFFSRREAEEIARGVYPKGWTGFRDYGSDVANLVAAAFIRQEIKRLIAGGASTFRSSRSVTEQPYTNAQPAVIEP
jgi:hypothetical protein